MVPKPVQHRITIGKTQETEIFSVLNNLFTLFMNIYIYYCLTRLRHRSKMKTDSVVVVSIINKFSHFNFFSSKLSFILYYREC